MANEMKNEKTDTDFRDTDIFIFPFGTFFKLTQATDE